MATSSFYTNFVIKDEKVADIIIKGLNNPNKPPAPQPSGAFERGNELLNQLLLDLKTSSTPK